MKTSPEDTAKEAVQKQGITPMSEHAYASLMRLVELPSQMNLLGQRLAATMMVTNRYGVLAGIAGANMQGNPLKATNEKRYRTSQPSTGAPNVELPRDRNALMGQAMLTIAPAEYGDSDLAQVTRSGQYNPSSVDSSRSYYAKLTGPPLAPHGELSRVITNYEVGVTATLGSLQLVGQWSGIVGFNRKTNREDAFIQKHFDGSGGRFPKRDLRGALPWDKEQLTRQVWAWIDEIAKGIST